MHIVVYGILLRSSLKKERQVVSLVTFYTKTCVKQTCMHWLALALLHDAYNHHESLPFHGVLAIQDLHDLISTDLLVLWVAGQTVEDERETTGCGIMALKHESVHFCSYIFIWKTLLILILKERQEQNETTVKNLFDKGVPLQLQMLLLRPLLH